MPASDCPLRMFDDITLIRTCSGRSCSEYSVCGFTGSAFVHITRDRADIIISILFIALNF